MKMFFLTFFLIPMQCFCSNISNWIFIDSLRWDDETVYLFLNRESGLFSAHENCKLITLEKASFLFGHYNIEENNYAIPEITWQYPWIYYPFENDLCIQHGQTLIYRIHRDL